MAGLLEKLPSWTFLHDAAGVHDCSQIRNIGNDGEIVTDIYGRRTVSLSKATNSFQHSSLGRDIKAGRRFVQDDHLRSTSEGHCNRDALLLPTGQLVRVTAKYARVRREVNFHEHLTESIVDRSPTITAVICQGLAQLCPHTYRRVQATRRVLRYVGDDSAPS